MKLPPVLSLTVRVKITQYIIHICLGEKSLRFTRSHCSALHCTALRYQRVPSCSSLLQLFVPSFHGLALLEGKFLPELGSGSGLGSVTCESGHMIHNIWQVTGDM